MIVDFIILRNYFVAKESHKLYIQWPIYFQFYLILLINNQFVNLMQCIMQPKLHANISTHSKRLRGKT